MGNTSLKNALQNAGLSTEEFAELIKVDPKSVQRWVDGPTKPYPRNRAAIARALNLTERDLWPEQAFGKSAGGADSSNDDAASEVTGTWAHSTDDNAPDPISFIQDSQGAIDLFDNGRGIELDKALLGAILQQAAAGGHVRLLSSHPGPGLKSLIGADQVEVRVIDGLAPNSVLRVGDSMLLTFNLAGEGDQSPLVLRFSRLKDDGLYDRLVGNFETLWADARDTVTDPQQLDAYLTNSDADDPDEYLLDPAEPGTPQAPEQTQRRWPRRPT